MGIRFRKSIKIAPGVRVNVGKKSASVSVGGKGFRHTSSTTGKKTTSVGVPGSGLSYSTSHGGGKKKNSVHVTPTGAAPAAPRNSKVGGIVLAILGVLACLVGLPTVAFGGWIFLLIGVPCLFLGVKMIKNSKEKPEA